MTRRPPTPVNGAEDLREHLRREHDAARQQFLGATDADERDFWRGAAVALAAALDLLDLDQDAGAVPDGQLELTAGEWERWRWFNVDGPASG